MTARSSVVLIQNRFRTQHGGLFEGLSVHMRLELWIFEWDRPRTESTSFRVRLIGHRPRSLSLARNLLALTPATCDALVVPGPFTWEFPLAWVLARLRGIPILVFGQEWTPGHPSKYRRLLRPALGVLLRRTAAGIASGSRSKEFLIWSGLPAQRAHVAIGASPLPVSGPVRPPSESTTILFVGRLIPVKGIDILLQAFARIKDRTDASLRIVGDGPERDRLVPLAHRLGIGERVAFEGRVEPERLGEFYGNSRVLVLPSRLYPHDREQYEVWGYVLSEAAQYGRPIVTTDLVGAAVDFVHPGQNGYIVRAGDAEALAAALLTIVEDGSLADRLGEESRRIAAQANLEASILGFAQAIQDATLDRDPDPKKVK